MKLEKAIKKALKQHGLITRRSWEKDVHIQPECISMPCYLLINGKRYKNWNPTGEDFIAKDWYVV